MSTSGVFVGFADGCADIQLIVELRVIDVELVKRDSNGRAITLVHPFDFPRVSCHHEEQTGGKVRLLAHTI